MSSGGSCYNSGNNNAECYFYSDDGNFTTLGRHDSSGVLTDSLMSNPMDI